jgi:uncharacterized membrane protein
MRSTEGIVGAAKHRRIALGAAAGLVLAASSPAHAELKVCNQTRYLVNVAVGYTTEAAFQTEGWWTVAPSACSTPLKGPLQNRYVYVYAVDIDGSDLMSGSYSMCIKRRKFLIEGVGDCWRRGFATVDFAEVDTLSAPNWTVVLSDKTQ